MSDSSKVMTFKRRTNQYVLSDIPCADNPGPEINAAERMLEPDWEVCLSGSDAKKSKRSPTMEDGQDNDVLLPVHE